VDLIIIISIVVGCIEGFVVYLPREFMSINSSLAPDFLPSFYPRVPQKLKGKFYRTVIRHAMLYRAVC
jgi:hypothetical protein